MTKSILIAVLVAALSTGCATTKRMDIQDLRTMQIDCANKDAQIRFLQSQLTTPDDRLKAAFQMNVFTEGYAAYKGEKTPQRSMVNREYDAAANQLIWQLRSYCPKTNVAGTNVWR